jgi:hypothetical protein
MGSGIEMAAADGLAFLDPFVVALVFITPFSYPR